METPPNEKSGQLMDTAVRVLQAQASALTAIASSYAQPGPQQANFFKALDLLHNTVADNGKVIFTAMGKSYKIGQKLAATLNSLGIASSTLHPTEALHGDLGCISSRDTLIMITASGNTPELLALDQHLAPDLVWLCITCVAQSPLGRASSAVIEAAVPSDLSEMSIYGLAAPTVSTTACLAVGDALCISLNEMLVSDPKLRALRFGKWHPGGAIGKMYRQNKFFTWDELGSINGDLLECSELDLWRASSTYEYIVNDYDIYSSADLVEWLKSGRYSLPTAVEIQSLPHLDERSATDYIGMCVVIKGSQKVGLRVSN